MRMDPELQQLQELRTEPTRARWKDEFRAILAGRRANRLRHLGGVQEYVEVLLANAAHPRDARDTFAEALEEFVHQWQPAKFHQVHQLEIIFDLLAAFTPYTGFIKVAEQLRVWAEFQPLSIDGRQVDATTTAALRRRALDVLRAYFPVAPPDPTPAFRSYVAILEDNLSSPVHCGRALARLVDLHIYELEGNDVRAVLRSHPAAMRDLVEYAFQPVNSTRLDRMLSQLYGIVTETGTEVEEHFTGALKRFQAVLRDERNRSVIALGAGGEISLELPEEPGDNARYLRTRWNREEAAGWEKLDRIMDGED
jgi:hypothetical protein